MNHSQKCVLVADDDVDVALSLARAVRSMGEHEVVVAYTGLEALEKLRARPVDILLSDIDMPGLDGVALVCHARNENLASVRILLTGNARLETALLAMNRGEVYRYLTKPWHFEELVRTLEDAMVRLSELSRLSAADQAVRRLRAACDALEEEYPGITRVEREGDVYTLAREGLDHTGVLFASSPLALLLSEHRQRRHSS
jgi:DNA-binding NtrC family response regulator